ncbi:hypothetical protein [Oxynema aestuarii]|uniref:Uncharacterized protein n=1 Tax=Oxynema aestuarii AP17 TaxID=2064643 RepID=A0A6H1TZJ2_9CYAN|nr:hypothetical protein [Oxynema aestuarii]QIZ71825.1 hypothetical protein HCG48_15575 [Oxynema aestuarii AP17]
MTLNPAIAPGKAFCDRRRPRDLGFGYLHYNGRSHGGKGDRISTEGGEPNAARFPLPARSRPELS